MIELRKQIADLDEVIRKQAEALAAGEHSPGSLPPRGNSSERQNGDWPARGQSIESLMADSDRGRGSSRSAVIGDG